MIIILSLFSILPSFNSECVDCPADAPVKWTSVQNCGCDFRGPQGPAGPQGATGPRGPMGNFGPGAAEPLNPSTVESTDFNDYYHYELYNINAGVSLVFFNFYTINSYANSSVRIIFNADVLDRCPQDSETALTGSCPASPPETVNDLTFTYDLYSAGGPIDQTLTGATLLDTQTVQFQPVNPDNRFLVLQGVVTVGLAEDYTNRFLYLIVRFTNPTGLTASSIDNRRMRITLSVSVLAFPLNLNSQKKRELDAEYRQYFLEEDINPSTIDTNFL